MTLKKSAKPCKNNKTQHLYMFMSIKHNLKTMFTTSIFSTLFQKKYGKKNGFFSDFFFFAKRAIGKYQCHYCIIHEIP